jgi:hypothetical protein
MALLRNISIGMSADTSGFTRGIYDATSALDRLNDSSLQAQSSLGNLDFSRARPGGGGGGAARSGAAGGMDGGAAALIASSLAPLSAVGSRISAQMNAIGGTFTTLARRIDAAIKFPATKRALDEIQASIRSRIGAASEAATGNLSRLQRATLAVGPAALAAIGAYRGFTNVATIFNTLTNRGDVARKGLDQLAKIRFDAPAASATRFGGSLATISPTAERAAGAVKGLGLQIGLALGAVGLIYKGTQALMGFFVGGVKGAMDLGETLSKTREVFGGATAAVVGQAEQMAASFGLAKGPMLDAASSIGLIAEGAGQSKDEAAGLANSLTRLAADAASFYNVPMETALEKIRSGLVGESEPLRQFGVLLSEEAVKVQAAATGLDLHKGKLDESSKVAARAALITKGLQTASGDLARTQDSASNQFRKSGGGLQNFATTVGSILLPALKSGIGAFNELLATVVDVFESNRGLIEGWAGHLKAAFDLTGSTIRNFGDYWALFKLSAVEQISNVLAVIETLPANLGLIAGYVAGNWRELIVDAVMAVGSVFENLGKNLGNLGFAMTEFLSGRGFSFEWTGLLDGFKATAAQLPELIQPEFISMQREMDEIFARIAGKEAATARSPLGAAAAAVRPELPGAKGAEEGDRYHGVAAVEMGSKEANSALVKFLTGGGDEPAKTTAKNTDVLVKLQQQTLDYLKKARSSGDDVALAIARL